MLILPDAMPAVPGQRPKAIDLRFVAWTHKHRGLWVAGTWWLIPGEEEPCLALFKGDAILGRDVPCIVRLSNLWLWSDTEGDEARRAEDVTRFCGPLGLDHLSPRDRSRVIGAVQSGFTELRRQQPLDEWQRPRREIGAVRIRDEDGALIREDPLNALL